jgi:hypothetical protein
LSAAAENDVMRDTVLNFKECMEEETKTVTDPYEY